MAGSATGYKKAGIERIILASNMANAPHSYELCGIKAVGAGTAVCAQEPVLGLNREPTDENVWDWSLYYPGFRTEQAGSCVPEIKSFGYSPLLV